MSVDVILDSELHCDHGLCLQTNDVKLRGNCSKNRYSNLSSQVYVPTGVTGNHPVGRRMGTLHTIVRAPNDLTCYVLF
jgi:hypothetical protein